MTDKADKSDEGDKARSTVEADPLLERLSRAAEGLFIISETDSLMTPFRWTGFYTDPMASKDVVEALRRVTKLSADMTVETVTLEKFFRTQTEPAERDDEEIAEEKRRLGELHDLLKKELEDVAVYRAGTINITAYVLGKIPGTEDAAGVYAELVET